MAPSTVLLLVAAILVMVALRRVTDGSHRRRLHRVDDGADHERLYMDVVVPGVGPMLFLVDTAFVGAPVLNLNYVRRVLGNPRAHGAGHSVRTRARLVASEGDDGGGVTEHQAVKHLVTHGACRTYSSGCAMKLMGIGQTRSTHSRLLLCGGGGTGVSPSSTELFLTHSFPHTAHILTLDVLLHHAPSMLLLRKQRLLMRAPRIWAHGFEFHAVHTVGGAMCVTWYVDEVPLKIVVDTGATFSLSLSPEAAKRVGGGLSNSEASTLQVGVHGERVCSDVHRVAHLRLGRCAFRNVQVFVNDTDVEGADGYVGLGVLRTLDLWLEPGAFGVRRNGLEPLTVSNVQHGRTCASRRRS